MCSCCIGSSTAFFFFLFLFIGLPCMILPCKIFLDGDGFPDYSFYYMCLIHPMRMSLIASSSTLSGFWIYIYIYILKSTSAGRIPGFPAVPAECGYVSHPANRVFCCFYCLANNNFNVLCIKFLMGIHSK